MEFVINQKELEKALEITANVASKKIVNPALQGTLIIAKEQVIEIQSSDSELFASIKIPCEIRSQGSVLVKTALLRDIIKNFVAPNVHIKLENQTVFIESKETKYKVKLGVLSQDAFPPFPQYEGSNIVVSLPSVEFKAMLIKTIPFAAKDDVRRTFNSLLFDKEDMEFKLISSDTKRLALIREHITQVQDQSNFLLPIKTAQILRDMFSKPLPVDISLENNLVIFRYDNMVLVSYTIDGNFPDYRAVIPSETPYIVSFAKDDFAQALKTLSPFYNNIDFQKVSITLNNNELLLETEEHEMGKGVNNISTNYSGESITLAFNFKYIQEILSVIEDPTIIMKILAPEKPVIIQGESKPNDIFICVPMKK